MTKKDPTRPWSLVSFLLSLTASFRSVADLFTATNWFDEFEIDTLGLIQKLHYACTASEPCMSTIKYTPRIKL